MNDAGPQFELFTAPPLALVLDGDETIQGAFERFHTANTWVLDALVRLAEHYRDAGYRRIGIGHLTEVLRWEYRRKTQGNDFRLNNNHRSRYARLIQQMRPDLAPMFETRHLKAA